MTIRHIDTGEDFDVNESESFEIERVAGILFETGEFKSGGTTSFNLPFTGKNQRIIEDFERSIIRVVIQQGVQTIAGEMIVLSRQGREYYQVEVQDMRASVMRRLKDLRARDVYMDDLNHQWNEISAITLRDEGWIYPLVDYGFLSKKYSTPNITAFGLINSQFAGDIRNDIFNWRPAMFAFDFVRRAFKQAGWEISGSVFEDGHWFKKLVIPATSGQIPRAEGQAVSESGAAYVDTAYTATPGQFEPLVYDTTTNPTYLDTTTGRYTAIEPCFVNFRALVVGDMDALDEGERFAIAQVRRNGNLILQTGVTTTTPGEAFQIEVTGDCYLSAGDYLEVWILNPPTGFDMTNFPGIGSRFEVSVVDTVAYGGTIQMSQTLPDVSAADLCKSIIAGVNLVMDEDFNSQSITLTPFWEYYGESVPVKIDQDRYAETTISSNAQNNYLQYSGDNGFANGGFTIHDLRLDREKNLFTSIFAPTQMHSVYFGGVFAAKMFDSEADSLIGDDGRMFRPILPATAPRLLLIERRAVEDFFNGMEEIYIAEGVATAVNYGYFYNVMPGIDSKLSLAYKDIPDAIGLNLAEFAFEKYAQDFVKYKALEVEAAMKPDEFALFDFRNPVEFDNDFYRVLSLTPSGEGLVRMQLRRIGTLPANLNVKTQIGKDKGSPGASGNSGTNPNTPPPLVQLPRIMLNFEAGDGVLDIDAIDPNSTTLGEWVLGKDYATVPQTGYYDLYFQCYTDGGNLDSLSIIISDNTGTELWRRTKAAHSSAHSVITEEYLLQGYRVSFEGLTAGSHLTSPAASLTFANISQRGTYG